MNAQQLRNSILQDIFCAREGWLIKDLKDIVADSCPISYGIVQQGNHVNGGVPVIRPVDLHTKYVSKTNLKCTSIAISDSYKRTILNGNEVLLCVRGTTGIVSLATTQLAGCNVNRGIVPLYFDDNIDRLFIYYQLQAPFVQKVIEENTMGSALKQINIKDLRNLKMLVPPLVEQKRIVAKIEELLPKVEEYGKAQEALDKLNKELPERLKKSILQEAISGRLVPQDPNDEPASVLLDKIRKEKAQLVKEGKLKKKDLIETPITDDEKPFDIPQTWEWVRLSFIAHLLNGYAFKSGLYVQNGIRVIRITNVQDGEIVDDDPKYYPICEIDKIKKYLLAEGDLLMSLTGNVGRVGILDSNLLPAALNQRVACIRLFDDCLKDYIFSYYRSDFFRNRCVSSGKGMAQLNISTDWLGNDLLPLPPLAEQKRIVAKIEELFAEIDKLKA